MVTSVTQSCPLKLNHSSQDPNVAPHPSVYIWNVSLYKEPLENLPFHLDPRLSWQRGGTQRHSRQSAKRLNPHPAKTNRAFSIKSTHRILNTRPVKAIVSSMHYQGKFRLQQQVCTISEWRIHFLTDQLFGSLRFNVSTGVDGDVKCYFICTHVCVFLERNVDNIFGCMGLKRHVYFQAIEFHWQIERQRQSNITWCFVEKLYFK